MKTEIFKNITEFWARPDQSINGVSEEFSTKTPNYEK